jgi:hypothetical protein
MILLQVSFAMMAVLMIPERCNGGWGTYVPLFAVWTLMLGVGLFLVPLLRGTWPTDADPAIFPRENVYVFTCTVLVILVVVCGYAGSYRNLSLCDPASFNAPLSTIDALYFSLTTLTTVGYGDLVPRSQTARIIVSTQLLLTIVFAIVIVGTVVAILGQRPSNRNTR